jgi:hypothetical protein
MMVAERIEKVELSQVPSVMENTVRFTLTKKGKSTDVCIGNINPSTVKISEEPGVVVVHTTDGAPVRITFDASVPLFL